MAQEVFPHLPPRTGAKGISTPRPVSSDAPRCVEAAPCRGSRNGQEPSPVPASSAATLRRRKLLELQDRIARIERPQAATFVSSAAFRTVPDTSEPVCARRGDAPAWFSGCEAADLRLGPGGLARDAVHEIKPIAGDGLAAAALVAALGFALELAGRCHGQRKEHNPAAAGDGEGRERRDGGLVLLCATSNLIREIGRPYGPGLAGLGLEPQRLLLVETARDAETLWALEEGLKSTTLAAVVGCLPAVDLTPARRLSLAAKACGTPCLLVTGAAAPSAGATASRWRIAMRPGGRSPMDAGAPGEGRRRVILEKLRGRGGWAVGADGKTCSVAAEGRDGMPVGEAEAPLARRRDRHE